MAASLASDPGRGVVRSGGALLWSSDNRHVVRYSVVDERSAILLGFDGSGGPVTVTSAQSTSGKREWSATFGGSATAPPLVTNDRVLLSTAVGVERAVRGKLTLLDRDDGEVLWEAELADIVEATPSLASDTVVAVASHQSPPCL